MWWTPFLVVVLTRVGWHVDSLVVRWSEGVNIVPPGNKIDDETVADARAWAVEATVRLAGADCAVSDAYIAMSECVQTATFFRASSVSELSLPAIPVTRRRVELIAFVFKPRPDFDEIFREAVDSIVRAWMHPFGEVASDFMFCALSKKWSRRRRLAVTRRSMYRIYLLNAFFEGGISITDQAGTFIHECSHLVLGTVDMAYRFEKEKFSRLTWKEHDQNGDSYVERLSLTLLQDPLFSVGLGARA